MIPALRILILMPSLHRLFPLWLVGMWLLATQFSGWLILGIGYGIAMQFIVEYVMHRFLYHRAPPTDQGVFNDLYRTHIGHHEYPADPEFFTGDDHWYAVRFGLISVVLHTLALWSAVALFVGSVSAFAFYEYCHTLAHLNVPKGWLGQKITRDHLAHHYQDHHATFHVSLGAGEGGSQVRSSAFLPRRYESEGRSHAFNATYSLAGDGMLGVPTVTRVEQSNGYWWYSDVSDLSFLGFDAKGLLADAGMIAATPEDAVKTADGYDCEVSCIDWYGNARPIFLGGKVYGLMATELVEAEVVAGKVSELRRVDLTGVVAR